MDEDTKARLRLRAAHHARSMEKEAHEILRVALADRPVMQRNLAESIRSRFGPLGGIDLFRMPREPVRRPPRLGK